ncbi:MAG: hypothetical protein H7259_08455 [Cytophagales bacterium]|nr:hypothetical protein [Cytophaga sp.]
MNKQRYIALLQNPSSLSKEDIPDLEELIAQFPYCQNAYVLLAKIQSDNGNMHAAKLSRKAALYTSDRNKLKNLLNNKPSYAKPALEMIVPKVSEQHLSDEVIIPEVPVNTVVQELIESSVVSDPIVSEESETALIVSEMQESIIHLIEAHIVEPIAPKTALYDIRIEADKNANAFLEELEENLKKLKESRARAVGLLPPFSKEQVDEINRTNPAQDKIIDAPVKTIEAPAIVDLPVLDEAVELPVPANSIAEIPEEPVNLEKELSIDPELVCDTVSKFDPTQKNDVLDLILSFDTRVRDYFDINQYSAKNDPSDLPVVNPVNNKGVKASIPLAETYVFADLPFSNKDWNLEESRMEESSKSSEDSLLLNYLDYIRDQKNKKQKPDKTREKSIISRFIQKHPTISPLSASQASSEDEDDSDDNSSKNNSQSGFVSETFAILLEKQGKIEKAIGMYEELSLKNPEKKPYFAIRIQELKKNYNIQ